MAFVNGYPTEEDIKLPLYTVEPSQLSDLVAVPTSDKYYNIKLINHGVNPSSGADQDIQAVNYPLSIYPCLFQRYNPYGLPFADGYSLKLYKWLRKYSQLFLVNKTRLFGISKAINQEPILIDHPIGRTLKIKLPNTRKKLDLSYYYPELNPFGMTIASSFFDFRTVDPEEMDQWRTVLTPYGKQPVARSSAYEFRKVDNDCIRVPVTRSWLLRFNTYFCLGQEIEIDEDILIASLVFNFYDFNDSEIEYIKGQIPECYFYDYLDTFFDKLDNAILTSNPQIFSVNQVTKIDYTISFDYQINHFNNSIETVTKAGTITGRNASSCTNTNLTYKLHPNNKYLISASGANNPYSLNSGTTVLSDNFKFGCLIFANNNFWDNYDFSLSDLGNIQLSIGKNRYLGFLAKHTIEFNYLGNVYGFNSSGDRKTKVFLNLKSLDTWQTTTFTESGFEGLGTSQVDALQLIQGYSNDAGSFYNNKLTRLFYNSASFPEFLLATVGNHLKIDTYTVANSNGGYYERGTTTKIFEAAIQFRVVKTNYLNNPSFSIEDKNDAIRLGTIPYTWDKYGLPSPAQNAVINADGYAVCEPKNYYPGGSSSSPKSETKIVQPNIIYERDESTGRLVIKGVKNLSTIDLSKMSFSSDTSFTTSGTFTKTYSASLVPATELKELDRFIYPDSIFDYITQAHERCTLTTCDLEQLKKQVNEIWLALEAGKYAYREGSTEIARDWNLGQQIEAQSTVLGLSFNSDYSIRSIRQGELIEQGDTIPAGWNFGQFGKNTGGSSTGQMGGHPNERRFGIAYEVRTNTFENDDFTGETNRIKQGGIVLAENIPQLLHFVIQDFDRGLGLQDMGANVLPTPNGQIASYTGLNQMMLDSLYTLSQISKQTASTNILALKNQAMSQEILSGFGLPIGIKEIEISANSGELGVLPFPGFELNAPTLADLIGLNLLNLGSLLGSQIQIDGNSKAEE